MRKVFAVILCFGFILSAFNFPFMCVNAEEKITSGDWWELSDDGKLTVYGISETPKNAPWNHLRNEIKSVEIKDGVSILGQDSFYSCENLISVSLPESLTIIGASAFKNCTSLCEISLPKYLKVIDIEAFRGCSALGSIDVSDSVERIGDAAFFRTKFYYDEKNWQDGILYLENYLLLAGPDTPKECIVREGTSLIAEYACSSVNMTSVDLPNGLEIIGSSAFYRCESLEKIDIPQSVTMVGIEAFLDTAIYNNPNNWKDGALYFNLVLISASENVNENFAVKSGTKVIADCAFDDNLSIRSIEIPESVVTVGYASFYRCANLENVFFSEGLLRIGSEAFYGCEKLKDIYLPKTLTVLESHAFDTCTSLTTIELGQSLSKIEDYTFYDTAITYIKIPEGVVSIGKKAFYDCKELKAVDFPSTLKYIGNSSFDGCYSLEMIPLYEGVEFIGERAFSGCFSVNMLYIPNSVTEIGEYAFSACQSIKVVYMGEGVTTLKRGVFNRCSELAEVDYTNSKIKRIEPYAFYGCYSLTKVYLPESVEFIGEYAFYGCYNLMALELSKSISYVGDYAFVGALIYDIVIPQNVNYIGENSLGYLLDGSNQLKNNSFKIYGTVDTAAELYAIKHGFDFTEYGVSPKKDSVFYMDLENKTLPNIYAGMYSSELVYALGKVGIFVTVSDKNGEAFLEESLLTTGCIVTDPNGEKYEIVIKGDVDGTGEINSTDYLQIKSYFLNCLDLDGAYYMAADTNNDGEINSTDYIKIKSYLLGLAELY